MLDSLFIAVLNISLIASYVILFIIIARFLLKKTPKIFSYALWCIVLFKLICPFSFESAIGLLPSNTEPIPQDIVYQKEPQINTGMEIINDIINPALPAPNVGDSVNPLQIWTFIGSYIWIIGIVIMLIFSVIQFVKLKKKLIGSTPLRDNIFLADHISSPFVIGLFRPKIYLPSSLSENEQDFIIAHEMHHIKRFDHITRILGFIALTIHWFNPLVWIAFVLSGKDMEMSCDEAVMKKMDNDIRAEYSTSLLRFATGKRLISATPLAFGEGDTKGRVKNVMKYKKPVIWVSIIAIVAVACVTVGFMSNPKGEQKTTLQTEDLKEMIIGAELPYLLYANNDYCIMNIWHGGAIVYDFDRQEIVDRITFEKLEKEGFQYPILFVSENGETIYFQEDAMISSEPNTHSYSLQTKELKKEKNDNIEDIFQFESTYESHKTKELLPDDFAYGMTFIELDDVLILSRIKGFLLADTEIVFMSKNLEIEKIFTMFDGEVPNTTYSITKIGKDGEISASNSVETQQLAEDIIFDAIVKSAAWEGVDIATLEECYLIRQTLVEESGESEIHDYYVYRLEDDGGVLDAGTPVLQGGTNGMYTSLSEELYLLLEKSVVGTEPLPPRVTMPMLSADDSIGVNVILDYADDEKIVFHGYFGLFVYDLVEERLSFVADLKQAVGTNAVQGSVYAEVLVSGDGKTLMAYQNDTLANYEEITVLYVNLETGKYDFAPYEEFDYILSPKLKENPFKGTTLGELRYVTNGKEYLLFDGYKFQTNSTSNMTQETKETVSFEAVNISSPDENNSFRMIGEISADTYLNSFVGNDIPAEQRLESYELTDVRVTAGDPKQGVSWEEMKYQYVANITYNITTASKEYLVPSDGTAGKGTFEGLTRELSVKALGNDLYEIVHVGTGGAMQEFKLNEKMAQ